MGIEKIREDSNYSCGSSRNRLENAKTTEAHLYVTIIYGKEYHKKASVSNLHNEWSSQECPFRSTCFVLSNQTKQVDELKQKLMEAFYLLKHEGDISSKIFGGL